MLTRAIKLYTKKPYNHVSISFNEDLTDIYSFGRKMPSNPFIGGFVKEDLNTQIFKEAGCAIYSYEVTEQQYNQMLYKVREMENERNLYRYNFIGLLAAMAHLEIHRKYAYFCSQFVAMILQEGDIYVADKPICFTSPYDIQACNKMELVFEGPLKKYLRMQREEYEMDYNTEESFLESWLKFL